MAASAKAPKPWKLTEEESFASYTSWQHNLIYTLSRDDDCKPFLKAGTTWNRLTSADPKRGIADAAKAANLQQMLGLITQWVPHYLATDITNNSTSMDSIWQFIRKYYGFQQSETQFMKLSSIVWEEGERPERLYQRILAHFQDNLLRKDSKLKHNEATPDVDEDMSPTVERMAVLRWIELIHPSLPALVQRTFAYDLQRMTLKDLQPQIADALDGFLEELRHDEIKASRVYTPSAYNNKSRNRTPHRSFKPKPQFTHNQSPKPFSSGKPSNSNGKPQCRVCKSEGRQHLGHTMYQCDYISKAEKRNLVRSYRVETDEGACEDAYLFDDMENLDLQEHSDE